MSLKHYKTLPSLGALATFEVAAKHLSFTIAASELHVTQAAVSQQIRALEKQLNTSLFQRLHNGLKLTDDGKWLLQSVQQGLGTIGTTVNAILGEDNKHQSVTITATAGVSHFFLWPLVRDYIKDYPQAQVVILSSDEDGALHDFEEVDLALVCGNERFDAGEQLRFLFPEIVRPVCSALYLEKNGPFPNAAKLNEANLLHLHRKHWHSRAISWQPLDWEGWFASQGEVLQNNFSNFQSNSYPTLIQAAIDGEGIALGWEHLVHRHLLAGDLVNACDQEWVVDRGNYLKINSTSSQLNPHVNGLADRILKESVIIRNKNSYDR